MTLMIGCGIALIFGLVGSLFFIRGGQKERLSQEINLGTILFITVNNIWLLSDTAVTLDVIIHLGILWAFIAGGIGLGEQVHSYVVRRVIKVMNKQNIEMNIAHLVYLGQGMLKSHKWNMLSEFNKQGDEVQAHLSDLLEKSKYVRNKDILRQINDIKKLVDEYTTLVTSVSTKEETMLSAKSFAIGDMLIEVSRYTLTYAENFVRQNLFAALQLGVFQRKI